MMLKVCMIAGLAAAAAGGYMYPSEVPSEHPAYRVEESHGDGGVEGTSGKPDGDDAIGMIMRLLGTDSPESLDEYEVERLSSFLETPLRINLAPGSRLVSSGLLTQYQVASLLDYRRRHGDVLSFMELSALDGFSEETVRSLAPFISLDSVAPPGRSSAMTGAVHNTLVLRANARQAGDGAEYAYGMKYRFSSRDRFQFGITLNRPYAGENPYPDGGSFYFAGYGRRHLGKIVIGDYSLRYGQGLALWNGFMMSSLSSPESFYLRPSGISPYWSYSGAGANRGIAADFNIGRFVVSSSVALPGLKELMSGDRDQKISLMPAVNVAWYGTSAQLSVTGYADVFPEHFSRVSSAGASADFRWCVRGVDLFGEVAVDALDLKPASVAGTVFSVGENLVLAFRGGYADGQYSIAAGGRFRAGDNIHLQGRTGFGSTVRRHSGTFSADAAYYTEPKYGSDGPGRQLKLLLNYTLQLNPALALAARLSERLRNGTERTMTDFRVDIRYAAGDWTAVMRLNALYNKSLGLLGYVEGGWKPDRMSIYLRAGLFKVDNWSDRIYAYERDAPGNFNVPAYYGRGWWCAMTAGITLSRWCKAYFRLSTLQYPWTSPTASARTPKSECRILFSLAL